MANELRAAGEVTAGENLVAYYVSIIDASAETLAKIQDDERVLLADVGRFPEFAEAVSSGMCAKFSLPDPLWYKIKELDQAPE